MDYFFNAAAGADPGFFLGGGALVSCSTSTPINHIVFFFFFCRIPVVLENCKSSQGGVRTPCTLPLDPPLSRQWLVLLMIRLFDITIISIIIIVIIIVLLLIITIIIITNIIVILWAVSPLLPNM